MTDEPMPSFSDLRAGIAENARRTQLPEGYANFSPASKLMWHRAQAQAKAATPFVAPRGWERASGMDKIAEIFRQRREAGR